MANQVLVANVKQVPVSSDYGYSILDNVVASNEYIDVSKQLLSVIEFRLPSTRGEVIPLHGSHVGFSILFSAIQQYVLQKNSCSCSTLFICIYLKALPLPRARLRATTCKSTKAIAVATTTQTV